MKSLLIGLGLVGGAAWLGSRNRGGLGVLAKAITPGMAEDDFIDEYHYRAQQSYGLIDSAIRDLYDAAEEELSDKPNCASAQQLYMQARDAVKSSREASRDRRVPALVNECGSKTSEKCRRFRDATYFQDTSMRVLMALHRDIGIACSKTMPRPFAGLLR